MKNTDIQISDKHLHRLHKQFISKVQADMEKGHTFNPRTIAMVNNYETFATTYKVRMATHKGGHNDLIRAMVNGEHATTKREYAASMDNITGWLKTAEPEQAEAFNRLWGKYKWTDMSSYRQAESLWNEEEASKRAKSLFGDDRHMRSDFSLLYQMKSWIWHQFGVNLFNSPKDDSTL